MRSPYSNVKVLVLVDLPPPAPLQAQAPLLVASAVVALAQDPILRALHRGVLAALAVLTLPQLRSLRLTLPIALAQPRSPKALAHTP
jgi:hypothetical protein